MTLYLFSYNPVFPIVPFDKIGQISKRGIQKVLGRLTVKMSINVCKEGSNNLISNR